MAAMASVLVNWVFPGLLVVAAMTDLTSRRIPNWIPAAMLAGFALVALAGSMGPMAAAAALGAGLIAFAIGFALFAIGQVGGGDVKLIATTLPWYGWTMGAYDFVLGFTIAGAALTLLFLVQRLSIVQLALVSNPYSARFAGRVKGGREIPYGVAIAAGGILTHGAVAALHLG